MSQENQMSDNRPIQGPRRIWFDSNGRRREEMFWEEIEAEVARAFKSGEAIHDIEVREGLQVRFIDPTKLKA